MSKITVTVESDDILEPTLRRFLEQTLQMDVGYEVVQDDDSVVNFQLTGLHFHHETIHDARTGKFVSTEDEFNDPDHTVRES